MTSLLILTVGTGTAGKHWDVPQGLANTIRLAQPRKGRISELSRSDRPWNAFSAARSIPRTSTQATQRHPPRKRDRAPKLEQQS